MKQRTRFLLFNRYVISSCLLFIVISFLSWAIFSEYFSAVFIWDLTVLSVSRAEYFKEIFPFFRYPVDGFALIQLILPVFSMMMIIPFLNSKEIFQFIYTRKTSYKRVMMNNILKTVIIGAVALFLAYLVFLGIGLLLLSFSPDDNVTYGLFSDIFGYNLYQKNMVVYFILEGFLRYFVFTIIYGLFGIAVSFLTAKTYQALIIPVAYYAVLSIIIAVFEAAFKIDLLFLAPTYTVVSGAREYTNIFMVLAPLLLPLLFVITVLAREFMVKKKRNDVYAVA